MWLRESAKYILNLQIALNRFGIGHTKLIQSYLISEIDSPIHKVLNLPNNHEPNFFLTTREILFQIQNSQKPWMKT